MSNTDLIHAYRHLLRASLHAVQFSYPARTVVLAQLRQAFRHPSKTRSFDPEAVRRTVWFLKAAAAERGLEHKIVKNLVKVARTRERAEDRGANHSWKMSVQFEEQGVGRRPKDPIKATAYEHYEATIAMLNHSMGLCLPVR